jgi:hypothetical protein
MDHCPPSLPALCCLKSSWIRVSKTKKPPGLLAPEVVKAIRFLRYYLKSISSTTPGTGKKPALICITNATIIDHSDIDSPAHCGTHIAMFMSDHVSHFVFPLPSSLLRY